MPSLLWILPALALLPCGWFAAAWHYKRKLLALQLQCQAERKVAAEHAQQARWQIGHLQAELAARPPMPVAVRDKGKDDDAAASGAAAGRTRAVSPDFPATAILTDGFPQTVLIRQPGRR